MYGVWRTESGTARFWTLVLLWDCLYSIVVSFGALGPQVKADLGVVPNYIQVYRFGNILMGTL